MIQFKSDHGDISVSSAVFSNITGMAATNCFGVKGMAYRSMTDGLVHLLRKEAMTGKPEQMHWIRERMEIDAPAWRSYVEKEAEKFYGSDDK